MELPSDNKLPFVGMKVLKKGCKLETSVYWKPTNTSLLLHHQSHIDMYTFTPFAVSPHMVYIKLSIFILSSLENDDTESSKRCVKLLLLINIFYP